MKVARVFLSDAADLSALRSVLPVGPARDGGVGCFRLYVRDLTCAPDRPLRHLSRPRPPRLEGAGPEPPRSDHASPVGALRPEARPRPPRAPPPAAARIFRGLPADGGP